MMNDDNNIDFESLKGILGVEVVSNLWAKVEIAKILTNRSMALMEEVNTELKFYMITHGIEDENS